MAQDRYDLLAQRLSAEYDDLPTTGAELKKWFKADSTRAGQLYDVMTKDGMNTGAKSKDAFVNFYGSGGYGGIGAPQQPKTPVETPWSYQAAKSKSQGTTPQTTDYLTRPEMDQQDILSGDALKNTVNRQRERIAQVPNRGMETAIGEEERKQQPIVRTGSPADQSIMKTQGQWEEELSKSVDNILDKKVADDVGMAIAQADNDFYRSLERQSSMPVFGAGQITQIPALKQANEAGSPEKALESLIGNANERFKEYFSQPETIEKIEQQANALGINPDDYINQVVMPQVGSRLEAAFEQSQIARNVPKSHLEYLLGEVGGSLGNLLKMGIYTKKQRQYEQQGAQQFAEQRGGGVLGAVEDAARMGIGMATDPLMYASGGAAGAATKAAAGTRLGGKILGDMGVKAASRFANGSVAQRMISQIPSSIMSGGLNLGLYEGTSGVINNYSVGEDTSFGNNAKIFLDGFAHGGVTGGILGVLGSMTRGLGADIGIKAGDTGWTKVLHGAEKGAYNLGALGVEGLGFHSAEQLNNYLRGEDAEITLQGSLEGAIMAGMLKLTSGHNMKEIGKGIANRDLGSRFGSRLMNFLSSDVNTGLKITDQDRKALSFLGDIDTVMKNIKTKEDAAGLYRQVMENPEIPFDTKQRFSAYTVGEVSNSKPIWQRLDFGTGDKVLKTRDKNGNVIDLFEFDTTDERNRKIQELTDERNNQLMINNLGKHYAKMALEMPELKEKILQKMGYEPYAGEDNVANQRIMQSIEQGGVNEEVFVEALTELGREMQAKGVKMEDTFVKAFAQEYNMTEEDLLKVAHKDYRDRTPQEQEMMRDFGKRLNDELNPPEQAHPQQSIDNGRAKADDTAPDEVLNPQVTQEVTQKLLAARQEYESFLEQKGLTHEDLDKMDYPERVQHVYENFGKDGADVVMRLWNAELEHQGFFDRIREKTEEAAELMLNEMAFKGKIDGEPTDNIITIRDANGNEYTLVSGDVSFKDGVIDPDNSGSSGLIIARDSEGHPVSLKPSSDIQLVASDPRDAKRAQLLENIQVDASNTYMMNGGSELDQLAQLVGQKLSVKPKEEPKPPLAMEQGGILDNAGGEAGANIDTGANEPPAAAPSIPVAKNGRTKLYHQVEPDVAIDDILQQPESKFIKGNNDPAIVADRRIKSANERRGKLDKKLQKRFQEQDFTEEEAEDITSWEQNGEAPKTPMGKFVAEMSEIQAETDYYENLKKVWEGRKPKKPVAPEEPVVGEDFANVPEWVYDTPDAARKRGYKKIEGHEVDRQPEKPMPQGKEVEVQYSTKDSVKGRMTVSELDEVQGSHTMNGQKNELHFIPEAQPKAEFGADRQQKASTNATEEKFRPELMLTFNDTQSAYQSSATQTNRRGEVIQGNGRRNLAEYIYAPGNETVAERYRQYLMEHADELGTTAEEIAKMEKPFAHIVLDVNDAEAIRLGQFKASDLESGGKEIPEVSTVTTKLGDKYSNFTNIVLRHDDPDASLAERIEGNAEEAVTWLNKAGVISDTEAKTLLSDKAAARQFVKDMLTDTLFRGASENVRSSFYELPKNVQSAIVQVVGREVATSADTSILKEVQGSIQAFHELSAASPQFAGVKGRNYEERKKQADVAVEDWLRQINIDGTLNKDKFSNFALELAKRYKSHTDQKSLAGLLRDYYDLVNGSTREASMFDTEPAQGKLTREEAIKKVFNIDYKPLENKENGRQRTVSVAGDHQESQAGGRGKPGRPESGEREEDGTGTSDRRGGNPVDAGEVELQKVPIETSDPIEAINQADKSFRESRLTPEERKIRDTIVEHLKNFGMDISTDWEEGQRLLSTLKDGEVEFFKTKDGDVYGFVHNGKIYIDPKIATSETPVHEYTHLWAEGIRRTDPKKWKQIVDVLKKDETLKPLWEHIKKDYPELKTDDRRAEEILAQFSGKKGAERLRSEAAKIAESQGEQTAKTFIQKMKQALTDFWKSVADRFGRPFTNVEDITDQVMKDLLSGRNPNEWRKKSLMGVHNLSEDKLRKVLKLGGLANPSMAVVDTNNHMHTDYGSISLIPKSSMIDARTGRNAGTFTADAWTPTYPTVQKRMSDKGQDKFWKDLRTLREEDGDMANLVRMAFDTWLDKEVGQERLAYWYLKEKGMNPELIRNKNPYGEDVVKRIDELTDNGNLEVSRLSEEQIKEVADMYHAYKESVGEPVTPAEERIKRLQERMNSGKPSPLLKLQQYRLDELKKYGELLHTLNEFEYAVRRSADNDGKPNVEATVNNAQKVVKDQNLQQDFDKWLQDKADSYGIEEWLYNGTDDRTGKQKWVRNTLQNASKLMKKEGLNGAVNWSSIGNWIAKVANKEKTLEGIRKNKKNLDSTEEEHEAFRERWSQAMYDIATKLGKGDSWSGENIMSDILGHKDYSSYLKREYGMELSKEDREAIDAFIKDVQSNYPTGYFETKFERPVMLDEFEVAVVPKDTSADLIDALKKAGLDVRTYDNTGTEEQKDINRKQATMDAVQGRDDIMFQKAGKGENGSTGKERDASDPMEAIERSSDEFRKEREEKLNNKYKDEKSEDLFLSLSQKEGEELYESAKEINRRIESGEARINRLGEEAERGRRTVWHRIGTLLAGNNQEHLGTLSKDSGREGLYDTEKAIDVHNLRIAGRVKQAARRGGALIPEGRVSRESYDGKVWKQATESRVYRSKDLSKVIKFTHNANRYYENSMLKRLDDFALFNHLFPESAYEVIGFANDGDGHAMVVSEQPYVEGKTVNAYFKGNTEKGNKFIDDYLEKEKGFDPVKDENGDTVAHTKGDLVIRDVNMDNVIIDKNGNLHVIDCQVERMNDSDRMRNNEMSIEDVSKPAEYREAKSEKPQPVENRDKVSAHVNTLKATLGEKIQMVDSSEGITNEKVKKDIEDGKKVMGWYDPNTGQVSLYMPNIPNSYEAEKTVWHETVGHKGMRELLGEEGYKRYMTKLWLDDKNTELGKYVQEHMANGDLDIYKHVNEWLGEQAEKEVKNPYENASVWQKVREAMSDALRKAGYRLSPSIMDVKYMTWLSEQNKKGKVSEAKKKAMLEKLMNEKYDTNTYNNKVYRNPGETEDDVEYRLQTGGGNTPLANMARQRYRDSLYNKQFAWEEAHYNYMAAYKRLQEAIAGGQKIPDHMNALMQENELDSKVKAAGEVYVRDFCKPYQDIINECIAKINVNKPEEAYQDLEDYMYMKTGLQVNRQVYVRDWLRKQKKNGVDVSAKEQDWYQLKADMKQKVENGSATLRDYYTELDKWIVGNVSKKYKADNHDKSGLTAFNGAPDGKSYDDADILDKVMNMENLLGKNSIKNLWDQTKRVTDFALDTEYAGGNASKESIDAAKAQYDWYLPLRGFDEKTAEDMWSYLNRYGDGTSAKILVDREGRKSKADAPIATAFYLGEQAIRRAARNQVKMAALRFARQFTDPTDPKSLITEADVWVHNIGTEQNPDWVVEYPNIKPDATPDEISQETANFKAQMDAYKQAGTAKKLRTVKTENIPYRFENSRNVSENIIEVNVNGDKHLLIVNDNPRAAQALNGLLKPQATKGLAAVNRFLSQAYTSWSPTFVARNAIRDVEFASSMLSVKEGWGYVGDFSRNYGLLTLPVAAGTGKPRIFDLFMKHRRGTLDVNDPIEKMFKEFVENGGVTGYVQENSIDKWREDIMKGVKDINKGGAIDWSKDKWNWFWDGIEKMGESVENAARFATYMTSRQGGKSHAPRTIIRAVADAKEVSVNFNRKGAGWKTSTFKNANGKTDWNTRIAAFTGQYLRDTSLFYNATVQGIMNSYKNAQKNPVGFAGKFAIPPFVVGALISLFNKWVHNTFDDPEKTSDDPYADLAEYDRRGNLCIYLGNNNFIKLPLSLEHKAFYGLGDICAGLLLNPKLRSVDKPLAVDVVHQLSTYSPVDYTDTEVGIDGPVGKVVGLLTPAPIKPILQQQNNMSWTGRPIQKENKFNGDKVPEYQKAYEGKTTELSVDLSDVWHQLWGGDDVRRAGKKENLVTNVIGEDMTEFIGEISPAKTQYLIEQGFGETGKLIHGALSGAYKVAKSGKDAFDIDEFNTRMIPVGKAFFAHSNEQQQFYRAKTKAFRYLDKMKDVEYAASQYKKQAKENPDMELKKQAFESEKQYKQYQVYKKDYKKRLDDLYKQIKEEKNAERKKSLKMEQNLEMQKMVNALDAIE